MLSDVPPTQSKMVGNFCYIKRYGFCEGSAFLGFFQYLHGKGEWDGEGTKLNKGLCQSTQNGITNNQVMAMISYALLYWFKKSLGGILRIALGRRKSLRISMKFQTTLLILKKTSFVSAKYINYNFFGVGGTKGI